MKHSNHGFRWITYIVIFLCLFSGMCQKLSSVDSFLMYPESSVASTALHETPNPAPLFQSILTNLDRQPASIMQINKSETLLRQTVLRRTQIYPGLLTLILSLIVSFISLFISTPAILLPALFSMLFIVLYIHKQDGGKSCLFACVSK